MNEAETKATYIDPVLKKAGWGVLLKTCMTENIKSTEQNKKK